MSEKSHATIALDWPRLSPEESQRRSRAFRESMDRRRSVRDFSSEPIPPGVLEEAIACAAHSPSGANQQPWAFVVITDPGRKARLREAAEAEERESYARRMSEEWLEALAPLGDGTRKKVKHYYVQESVGIAVGFHTPSPMGFLREVLGRPENEKAFAVLPVGYPAEGAKVPDIQKKPLAEVLVHR